MSAIMMSFLETIIVAIPLKKALKRARLQSKNCHKIVHKIQIL